MNETAMDSSWMDEYDPHMQPGLTCHIEIENETRRTMRDTLATTADALRKLAKQIEEGVLDDGFHQIQLISGEVVGELYLDHHSTGPR